MNDTGTDPANPKHNPPPIGSMPILPSVLPITFLPPSDFAEIQEFDFPCETHPMPYKVLAVSPNNQPTYVGYGIRETVGPCRIEPIHATADGRCEQLRRAGRKCDICEEFDPYHEVIVDGDDDETLVGYVCNDCMEEALTLRKKRGIAQQEREKQAMKKKMRAIKKAERQRRRAGRRGRG